MSASASAWIRSPGFDGLWLLAPGLLCALIAFTLPAEHAGALTSLGFLLLVVLIDAAHVYGTLFRAYFDAPTRRARPWLVWGVPLGCWVAGALWYRWAGPERYWRLLAYLAAFHFVRQAYGLMMMYARRERDGAGKWLDRLAIYGATLHPLLRWHVHGRRFDWFAPGDFIRLDAPALVRAADLLYLAVLALYAARALSHARASRVNWPKHLWLAGTALSWHAGIVARDSDFIFSLANIIPHGVPYLALVFVWTRRPEARPNAWHWAPLIVLIPWGLAFLEEGLWDRWIWREHSEWFGWLGGGSAAGQEHWGWLIPLLAAPQTAHYIQDAFLWRQSRPAERLDEPAGNSA